MNNSGLFLQGSVLHRELEGESIGLFVSNFYLKTHEKMDFFFNKMTILDSPETFIARVVTMHREYDTFECYMK